MKLYILAGISSRVTFPKKAAQTLIHTAECYNAVRQIRKYIGIHKEEVPQILGFHSSARILGMLNLVHPYSTLKYWTEHAPPVFHL